MKNILKKGMYIIMSVATAISVISMPVFANDELIGDIRFDFTETAEGFEANGEANIVGVANGVLTAKELTKDPNITAKGLDIRIDNQHRYVRFRMKNNTECSVLQIYIHTNNWSALLSVQPITIAKKSEVSGYKEYVVDISDFYTSDKPVRYDCFRFDFLNGEQYIEGTVDIDYIVLTNNPTLANDGLIKGVSFGKDRENAVDFKSDKDFYEVEVYRDIFNNLTADDVNIDFGDGFEDAKKKVTITKLVDKKYVDVVAAKKDGTGTRSYRFALTSVKRPAAATTITDTVAEVKDGKISFSGKVSPIIKPVTVMAYKNGDMSVMKYMDVIEPEEDGNFKRENINIYDDPNNTEYYELNVVFDVLGEQAVKKEEKVYVNTKAIDESLDALNVSDKDVFTYMTTENRKAMYTNVGVWLELYDEYTGKQAEMNTIANKGKQTVDIEELKPLANGSILAALTKELSIDKLNEYVIKYDKEVKAVEVEGKRYSELTLSEQQWILESLRSNVPSGGFDTADDFFKTLRKSMFLNSVNETPYMELYDLLVNNTDIIGNDLTRLKNQDTDIQDKTMKSITQMAAKEKFTSVDDMLDAVDDKIDYHLKEKSSNKNNTTVSGSGGGGGGTSKIETPSNTAINPEQTTEPENKDVIFNDIANVPWAKTAIEELYKEGIVNGVTSDSFEPEREIKREEFVKLICEAFGLGKGGNASFDDVDASEWYAPYIAKCVDLGIILGVSNTQFGTGENITREDMAVIINRALREKGAELETADTNIGDEAEISDYAINDVKALYNAGIITGTGDGCFSPKDFATRAEAAVIIYRSKGVL